MYPKKRSIQNLMPLKLRFSGLRNKGYRNEGIEKKRRRFFQLTIDEIIEEIRKKKARENEIKREERSIKKIKAP